MGSPAKNVDVLVLVEKMQPSSGKWYGKITRKSKAKNGNISCRMYEVVVLRAVSNCCLKVVCCDFIIAQDCWQSCVIY